MTYRPDKNTFESTNNSTTTPLASGATFTGTGEQIDFSQVGVMLKTDNDGDLYFDFSSDGTNWDSTFPVNGFHVTANIPEFHTAVCLGRYFRVRLVNDTGAQTFLRLTTYYGENFVPSSSPLNQATSIDTDAQIVRSSIPEDEVVLGLRGGVSFFTKFGYRTGLTASAGEETVWATTGNFTPMTTASTFTIAYNNTTDGLGTTGALSLVFTYIDSSGLSQTGIHTLGNTGSDVTSFSGLGINRAAILSSGTAQTNTNTITITETTGGTTQALIPAMGSVTQQAIFFADSNSIAVTKFLYVQTNKLSGGGSPRVTIKAYVFNRGTTQTIYEVFRSTIDTASETKLIITEPIGFKLDPTDVIYFVADTDTNNTDINIRFSLREYKRD